MHLLGPVEDHGGRGAVDRGHGDAGPEVHIVAGVPLRVVHEDGVPAVVAEQQPLGQRWPFVREFQLGAEQHDVALVPLVPQRLGGLGRGQPSTSDHK